MNETVTVNLHKGDDIKVKKGSTLLELKNQVLPSPTLPIMGAIKNNMVCDLQETIENDSTIRFIDCRNSDGCRMNVRGLSMLLAKAINDLYPGRDIKFLHSLSKSLYCRWSTGELMKKEEVTLLEARMRELVEEDIPFIRSEISKDEAIELFTKANRMDKVNLIRFRRKKTMKVYSCNGYTDYFFGRLPPSTGVLKTFELRYYAPGLLLRFPCGSHPDSIPDFGEQKKLMKIYTEYKHWGEILEVSDVASLNSIIMNGEINDFIRVVEALHEKKIARIADLISDHIDHLKLVFIAGPSSSGKTTFAQRLSVQLRVNGLQPVSISLDDYFVNKKDTPIDEDGNYDFDHIDAIDVELFNLHLLKLLAGEEVMLPRFDFKTGSRIENHRNLRLSEKNILLVEGIHGLNERLTETIPAENKFKIYVSALTQLNLDNHNRIPTTDTRIIRRIVRDNQFRNHDALATIRQWPSVRRGEEHFIFPFQEEADVMFNSAIVYEMAVLKTFVEPLLRDIPPSAPEYAEAKRLLSFTGNFLGIGTDEIPPNSILREFIGAACFFRMEVI